MKRSVFFFTSLLLSTVVHGANITFLDSHVKSLCVQYWDKDKDGELSEEEAAAVTSLSNVFSYDDEVVGFEELVYFTGLNKISANDFYHCKNLTYIKLPPQVTSIGNCGFYGCWNLLEIAIPGSVKFIGDFAFDGCARLESATFEEGLTTIGDYAFWSCGALRSLSIPSTLTSIAANAFFSCTSLSNITVSPDNKVFDSREDCNAIIQTNTNTMVLGSLNATFPESVTAIGPNAFYGFTKLESIDITNGIKTIGTSAFSGCTSLTSVSLPSTLVTIDHSAFSGCSKLSDVGLPEGLKIIEQDAFSTCVALKEISIPASVTRIGLDAFADCSKLDKVYVGFKTPLTISNTTFTNNWRATLYVPPGCVDAFRAAKYWNDFKSIVEWFPMGDVNHDGSVNVLDVTLVIDYILDKKPENFHYEEANVNGDEYINVLDVTKIIDIILGK